MNSWSQKRKLIYGGSTILVIVVVLGLLGWKLFYVAPTCFDGLKNGSETGVDCGGSCKKLCPSAFITPKEDWTSLEETAPGLYNVAAYVENHNIQGEAFGVPYHVDLFDANSVKITGYDGTFTLPPNRNTLAFKAIVNTGQQIPAKAVFQITGVPDWHKQSDRLSKITILDKSYSEDANSSVLTVTLKNNDVEPMGRLTVYVVLYDKTAAVIGFSSTVIDSIAAGATVKAPFTWGSSHNGAVISIEVLPVAE